jgi:hypothetical protein
VYLIIPFVLFALLVFLKFKQTPAYFFCSLIGYFEQHVFIPSDTQTADAKIDGQKMSGVYFFASSPALFLIRDIGR